MVSCMSHAFAALPFLEGTVWRYTESRKSYTTMKFTSGSGGYFIFNNYERKFIFTYYYNDGVGTIYRDHGEFRNVKDATRLASAKFLIDHDTLIYDGREFVRVREMENQGEMAEAELRHNGVLHADNGGQAGSTVNDYTWTGRPAEEDTLPSSRRPAQQNAPQDVPQQQYAPRSVPSNYTSGNASTSTIGKVKTGKSAALTRSREAQGRVTEHTAGQPNTQPAATAQDEEAYSNNAIPTPEQNRSSRNQQDRTDAPEAFAQASDISGFEERYVEGPMPTAAYNGDEEGRNVLRIWVDRDGKVVRAEPNQTGSTLTSAYYVKKAQLVASRLRLAAKKNAPRVQTGFLTVTFLKKK